MNITHQYLAFYEPVLQTMWFGRGEKLKLSTMDIDMEEDILTKKFKVSY